MVKLQTYLSQTTPHTLPARATRLSYEVTFLSSTTIYDRDI